MTENPWYLQNYADKFSAKGNQRLLPKIESAMAIEQANRNSHRDTEHLHPSEMSKDDWCPRSSWYKITGHEESDPQSFNLKRMNIFAEGHNIHDKWQRWMHRAGGLYGTYRCNSCKACFDATSPSVCESCGSEDLRYAEVSIYNEEYRIIGHADGIWEDSKGKAVVEIKSVGLGTIRWDAPKLYEGFDKGELTLDELWKHVKRPLTTHRRQVNLYMMCLGIHDAIVIYEWKPSQDVKEFHVSFDEDLAAPILAGAKQVIEALDTGEVPDKPASATHKSCSTCRFCAYKKLCWSKS